MGMANLFGEMGELIVDFGEVANSTGKEFMYLMTVE